MRQSTKQESGAAEGTAAVIPTPRPSMSPQEREAAIRWTGVQHTIGLIGWLAFATYRDVGWMETFGGIAAILGILQLPAALGRGPAGTLSVLGAVGLPFVGLKKAGGVAALAKKIGLGLGAGLLLSCGHSLPMPRTAADAQVELADMADDMRDLNATAGVACTTYGQLPALRLPCRLYRERWADAVAAHEQAQEAVELWALGEGVGSRAAQDVRDAALLVRGLRGLAERGELL